MFCGNCGKRISKDSKFCSFCGKSTGLAKSEDFETKKGTVEKEFAGFWIRFLAYIIDYIIILIGAVIILFVIWTIFPEINSFSNEELEGLGTFIGFLVFAFYFWIGTSVHQTTIGKRVLKLKVISSDENKVSWGKGFMREILGKFLSSLLLGIGYLMIAFTKEKQGLHDIIAGTYVVKEE